MGVWGGVNIPFLSSIVTVSFAHFMRNLRNKKKHQSATRPHSTAQIGSLEVGESRAQLVPIWVGKQNLPDELHDAGFVLQLLTAELGW